MIPNRFNRYKLYLLVIATLLLQACTSYQNLRVADDELLSERPLVVLTYNIHRGAADRKRANYRKLLQNGEIDLKPVIEAIRSINPDIVGLQEVMEEQQAIEIARALNMNYTYTANGFSGDNDWWGNAILSRFPIQSADRSQISFGKRDARTNNIIETTVFNKPLTVINLHRSPFQKDKQALVNTMAFIDDITTPVLLLGDFNLGPGDERLDIFKPRFVDSALQVENKTSRFAQQRGTFPSFKYKKQFRIDYILVEKEHMHVIDAGLLDKNHWSASDHIGYYAIIKLH